MSNANTHPHDSSASDTPQLPVRVVLGDLDQPLAELTPWQAAPSDHGAALTLDAEQRTSLSALLSQLPAVVQSAHGALADTYRLTFAPKVMQKMSDVMHPAGGGIRATAIDANKQIIGQGVLHSTTGVKALSAATAVWQGLTIVTAQLHLMEINARLARIEQGIDRIRTLLEAEQVSILVTGLQYVREASAALAHGNLSEEERRLMAAQIETIWMTCGQVAHTSLQLLHQAPQDFQKLSLSAWYYLNDSAHLAQQAITDYEQRASAYLLAVAVRSAALALREPLQLNQRISEERRTQIDRHLGDWGTNRDDFFRLAQHRVATDLSATISTQATIDIERRRLMAAARDANDRLDQQATAVAQNVRQGHISSERSLDLIVILDAHGQIDAAFETPLSITGVPHRVT